MPRHHSIPDSDYTSWREKGEQGLGQLRGLELICLRLRRVLGRFDSMLARGRGGVGGGGGAFMARGQLGRGL